MKKQYVFTLLFALSLIPFFSCSKKQKMVSFSFDFNNTHDRIWIGRDFWAIPLEDWRIQNNRIECLGNRDNMRVNLLSAVLKETDSDFDISFRMGLLEETEVEGSAGLRFGVNDQEDPDVRAACYFGKGIDAGITTSGRLFLNEKKKSLPAKFNLNNITFKLSGTFFENKYKLKVSTIDVDGRTAELTETMDHKIHGILSFINHFPGDKVSRERPKFWFDDLQISGTKFETMPKNKFGPILWSMYTLSRRKLKLTAQLPPIGKQDNQIVELQLQKNGNWQKVQEQKLDPDARIATFQVKDWDDSKTTKYRLKYDEILKNNEIKEDIFQGEIRHNPVDRPMVLGGMTCQHGAGFPYTPLVKQLEAHDADLLYFSGDQIYEGNGGYGIIRVPAEKAILSYLGKWYMFGWAFGDLMRNRPTICTPDDHDVFQGNIWGEGGKKIPLENWQTRHDDIGGYVQPAQMVAAVYHTQCAHLPDPFDPTPMEQNIPVFYTDLVYGRISFAVISDRVFKSSPQHVAFWEGRADHVKEPLVNYDDVEKDGLYFLGERQLEFLENWVADWHGSDMKVVLSQTIFANIATHHGGNKMVLAADLDSGGWPKSGRDKAIKIMRKGFVFHIVGDQHIPSLSQYGIEDFRNAGWVYCTPAIFVGYERRFQPEKLGWEIKDPPSHSLSNTGYYKDGLGNLQYVYAIGNPVDNPRRSTRYQFGQDKASGFGIIRFNQKERTIRVEAYKFLSKANDITAAQFPGWPHTINQLENYDRKAFGHLPSLEIQGMMNPVILIFNETDEKLEYALRIKGNSFKPKIFADSEYLIKIGSPEENLWKEFKHVRPTKDPAEKIAVQF